MYGIPNCVPEYYRELREREEHEWELEEQRNSFYERNKAYRRQKYIDGCDEIRFYPDECLNCQYGEEAMPNSEYDDMPTMICSNWKECAVYKAEVNEPFEEYIQWREDYVKKLLEEE